MACPETFESIIQATAPGSADRHIAPLFYRRVRRGQIRFQGVWYSSPELLPYEGLVAEFPVQEGQLTQELYVRVESRTVRIRPVDESLRNSATARRCPFFPKAMLQAAAEGRQRRAAHQEIRQHPSTENLQDRSLPSPSECEACRAGGCRRRSKRK